MSGIECAFVATLGRDGEVRTSKTSGKEYLRLACRCGDGELSQWISVTVFDQNAIAAADRLTKGTKVYVEGHGLKIDRWQASDGSGEKTGLSCMSSCASPRLVRINQSVMAATSPRLRPRAYRRGRMQTISTTRSNFRERREVDVRSNQIT
jgi:single-stranded DNA-binding protein